MQTIFEKIETYNKGLSPAKVARKYKLISEDPFRFLRGTNHLFYEDISKAVLPASPVCWICGDLHIENFGSYKGDNRLVYFDINDFDESILAPVAWELARVLTSILLAFDALEITDEDAKKSCELFLQRYVKILGAGKPIYIERRTANGIVKKFLRSVEGRTQEELFSGRTIMKKSGLRLNHDHAKHLRLDKALKSKLRDCFDEWIRVNEDSLNNYKVLDINFRLAGTGSVGIKRYVFLIEKNDEPGKYMLIDMKQAVPSSLIPFVDIIQPSWPSEAERMVALQRMMQNVAPARLGHLFFEGDSYLMQEMQPTKDRINFKIIETDFNQVCCVLQDMATIAASAHLRTVGRKTSCTGDELMAFAEDSSWQQQVLDYAFAYKKKAIEDYRDFKASFKELKNRRKADTAA